MRELSLPILNLPREQTVAFFQEQVIWLICQQPEGKSLLAECAIASKMKDKEVFVTLSCPTADIARKLKDYYLAALKRYGKWQQVPTKTLFKFPSCRVPYSISYKFAANSPTLPNESGDSEQPVDESPIVVPQTSELVTPLDESEETIQEVRQSPLPASLLSMNNYKVLEINRHVLDFVNERYDVIIGYDVHQLFERRQELNFQPDNVVNFHERLRKAKVLNTTLRSFRSSGAFGTYYGTFKYKVVWGVPCRASFFESFELAV
ncbi:MAG: hypothetical protein LDL41_09430, partial [Coleofasciculus sp. S288]|nr:hypothetical protein [Coleofasciculus sp. S288]